MGDARHPLGERRQHRRRPPHGERFQGFPAGKHQHDQRAGQGFVQQHRRDDRHSRQQVGTPFPRNRPASSSTNSGKPPTASATYNGQRPSPVGRSSRCTNRQAVVRPAMIVCRRNHTRLVQSLDSGGRCSMTFTDFRSGSRGCATGTVSRGGAGLSKSTQDARRAGPFGKKRCGTRPRAVVVEEQPQQVRRQRRSHQITPFDEADPVSREVFFDPQLQKSIRVAETVGVEVVHGQPPEVLVDQHIGGTADGGGLDATGDGEGSHERGFSGSQIPFQRDHQSRLDGPCQAFRQSGHSLERYAGLRPGRCFPVRRRSSRIRHRGSRSEVVRVAGNAVNDFIPQPPCGATGASACAFSGVERGRRGFLSLCDPATRWPGHPRFSMFPENRKRRWVAGGQGRPMGGWPASTNGSLRMNARRRATHNLSENPLTPARRSSIDGLLNERNRVFG